MILKADGDRRDKAAAAHNGLAAGVHQKEAARAVGVLHLTGLEAALAEQSALLVARGAGDRDLTAVELKGAVAVHIARGLDLRQHARGDVEQLKQFGIPAQVVDVVEHRAAGVGLVGDVDVAVRQLPDQPGVDRAEQQLASLRPLARAGHVVQQPFDLRAGEIRVRHKARLGADLVAPACLDDPVDDIGGTAALPDDGVCNRLAGGLVPDHGGLTLVGDADGGNVRGGDAELAHRAARHLKRRVPDLVRVVLDPAGLRENLAEFLLRGGTDVAGAVKENAAGGGSALIQGHDVFHGGVAPFENCGSAHKTHINILVRKPSTCNGKLRAAQFAGRKS